MSKSIFVSGIDTDAGKSYATGFLANTLMQQGLNVVTQKFIQTGNNGQSDDIITHRRIMGQSIDNEPWHLTAPEIYSYPASPHLSAKIDNRPVNLDKIDNARRQLETMCDVLLIEGAGGLMVPIDDNGMLTIDYPHSRNLPIALVTNSRLGSISHTLLALEAIASRSMQLDYLLYNTHFDSDDEIIASDTHQYIKRWVNKRFPKAIIIDVPSIN